MYCRHGLTFTISIVSFKTGVQVFTLCAVLYVGLETASITFGHDSVQLKSAIHSTRGVLADREKREM